MFFIKSKEEKVRSSIRLLTPFDSWYFCSHNGVTMVSHTWDTQFAIHLCNHWLKRGRDLKHYPNSDLGENYLLFTNRKELCGEFRKVCGVVGNMDEFKRFKDMFDTRPGMPLTIPDNPDQIWGSTETLGKMSEPQNFFNVANWAERRQKELREYF